MTGRQHIRFIRNRACLIAGVLLISHSTPLRAELAPEYADATRIDEIVVTASRREERALELPFTVETRDVVDLQQRRQVRTIPDAMREISGVMVQKTGHGQGSPYIRGFTGLRTLFLIDGIRLNNSTFREGPNQYWNTVDPYTIGRLEIVKGPASVLYGSDAIGGTVNAISRSGMSLDSGPGRYSRLVFRGATAEHSTVLRPEFGVRGNRFGFYGGFSLKDFGDLEGGGDLGNQPMTGYDEYDADLRLEYEFESGRRLVAAVQHVNQDDAWRVHRTVFGRSWHGTTTGSELRRSLDQRRTLAYLQLSADQLLSREVDWLLSLSHHRQDESRLRIRGDGRIDHQGTDVGTLGLWGQAGMDSEFGHWTIGAEFYRDAVDSFRNDYNADGTLRAAGIQGPVADDASYLASGLFVQNQLDLGTRSSLTTGLRYTRSIADADAVQDPVTGERTTIEDSWNDLTASIRYSVSIDDTGRTRVFAGMSQGFRAPNLSDLTRFDSARSNEIETPVSDLEPEEFLTYEVGIKHAGERWSGMASLFYTDIDDLIVRTPTGIVIDGNNEITKQNSSGGHVEGVELSGEFRLSDSWRLFGSVSWMDGVVGTYPTSAPTIVEEPIDRLMPLQSHLGGRWQPDGTPYWIEGTVLFAGRADKLSTRDANDTDRIPAGGTPGYAIAMLRGGWQVSDSLLLSLALENVLDDDYRIHGSGLNEAGRNLVLSVAWGG